MSIHEKDSNEVTNHHEKGTLPEDGMSRPREWVIPLKTLIVNDAKGLSAWVRQDREDETHVIDFDAYDAVVAQLEVVQADYKRVREINKDLAAQLAKAKKNIDGWGADAQSTRRQIERLEVENKELKERLSREAK